MNRKMNIILQEKTKTLKSRQGNKTNINIEIANPVRSTLDVLRERDLVRKGKFFSLIHQLKKVYL